MPFSNSIREEALVKAQRHCCVCHEFAGRSINVHHIKQEAEGGPNTLENAIVLCLRCHAEAGHFNPNHPLGTKYSPSELIRHRDGWYEACANGVAQFSSSIEIKVKRTYITGELHKYALQFEFHNGNKNVVSGWKLDIFIPHQFCVSTGEVEEHLEEVIENKRYRKFQVTGSEKLFLGESTELTDPEWTKIEYEVDHDIYCSARESETKIIWRFYSDSEPPVTGELTWDEMQHF
jgi:hypothetical protein